ncbi:hypothetical protein [Hyalangium sp.]|uniref:hypothetical protein n=1 Tax=Hyalangium sp. TaxID=2028555 RepID=UPI002D3CE353|nr:hypothetical protein [Hyalangium sp.]HYH97036.1 hypothetical protein [Hyalangium sp.]
MRQLSWMLSGALGLLLVGCGGVEQQGMEEKERGNSTMGRRGDALVTDPLGSAIGTAVAQGNTCGRLNEVTPTCSSSTAPEHAYTWTAPSTGTFTFTTAGSALDSILQVSDPATGSVLGCNDDAAADTYQSSVAVNLTAGQPVVIVVDGYRSRCGSFKLNIHGMSTTKRGLTWVKATSDSCGQTRVTCDYCDPYDGDTLCTESRPLLCIRPDGSLNCGEPPGAYDGWAGGTVALTSFLVRGTDLTSQAAADAICANTFGAGYRMAEHHDGGGWQWRAKGSITPLSTPASTHPRGSTSNLPNRFWVRISNQPGNCWD